MSWSKQQTTIPAGSTPEEARALLAAVPATGNECPEREEAVQAATEAAVSLIQSGALGDPEKVGFGVSMSGHANAGHAKTPGWSNDSLYVSIFQTDPPAG